MTKMLIKDLLMLLMMIKDCCRSAVCCCVVVSMSQLPFPLSDRVPIVVVAAVREGRYGDKDVDRGRVNVVVDNKGLLRETNKQTYMR